MLYAMIMWHIVNGFKTQICHNSTEDDFRLAYCFFRLLTNVHSTRTHTRKKIYAHSTPKLYVECNHYIAQ